MITNIFIIYLLSQVSPFDTDLVTLDNPAKGHGASQANIVSLYFQTIKRLRQKYELPGKGESFVLVQGAHESCNAH